jgi:beta-glucosidase
LAFFGALAVHTLLRAASHARIPLHRLSRRASFSYSHLTVTGGDTITASFTVTNTGDREGADVPQLYLTEAAGDKRVRLLGFERVELRAGESRSLTATADARLLAHFDASVSRWRIDAGSYRVALGKSADSWVLTDAAALSARLFGN